ncbi:acyl-CoA thioesterase [Microbacterium sp. 2MCAF23]|uniref:acyl-CoA thioesterase n=1 Tax=Microbacterium sp. 2MCAF23 TaxID=3232985 RepID=UPI003F9DCBD7
MSTYVHRVRVPEIDNQGFLFNSRYLEIADAALTEFLRAGGFSLTGLLAQGFDPSVVETTVRYRSPIRLDEQVAVRTQCTRVGTSSFDMSFEMVRDDAIVAQISTVYVNVDVQAERSRPIPAFLAEFLVHQAEEHLLDASAK